MKRVALLILLIFCGTISARNIEFAGRTWYVHNDHYGPGPNYFSDNISNIWVDANGFLHLRLRESDGKWYCPNIETIEPTGYGMHRFYIRGTITNLDPNIIFSPFVYYDTSHEIDIEFARWGETNSGINNAQFVVQPHGTAGNLKTFRLSQTTENTTHYFDWTSTNVRFKSFQGHHLEEQNPGDIIHEWNYDGADNPDESYNLKIHIITWLLNGNAPLNGKEMEMIVTGADYPCYESPDFSASDGTYTNFIKINWTKVDSADSYEIWRSLEGTKTTAEKIADNILTNFYDDNSALDSTNYYYWVIGGNQFGSSKFGAPDIGWHGTTNIISVNSLNFFLDGFTRKDGDSLPELKWEISGWSSGDEFTDCSNNMCSIFPGNGNWNWRGIRPQNVDGSECALNIANGLGTKISIKLEAMELTVTNSSDHDAALNLAILNIPVTGNPYEMDAKGISLYADYNAKTGKINLRLYRKEVPNNSGTSICDIEKTYMPGGEISLTFATENAEVMYNGETLFYGPHELNVSSISEWYSGFIVQNRDTARCSFLIDNAKITAYGNAFSDEFSDDFSTAILNKSKWFNSVGNAIVVGGKCKLTPGNHDWGSASLGFKVDQWNPLRFDPNIQSMLLDVQISDIEIDTTNPTGPDILFKTEFYPERNYSTSWNYNSTNLSISTGIDFDSGVTSLNVIAQLFTEAEKSQNLINETVNYNPSATLEIEFGKTDIGISYDGILLNSAAHNIDVEEAYKNGFFPMLLAQNYEAGRGSIFLANVEIMIIPEPLGLLIFSFVIWFFFGNRKGCHYLKTY